MLSFFFFFLKCEQEEILNERLWREQGVEM